MSVYITKINSELSKACKEGDYHYVDDLLTLNITQIDYTLYGAVKSLIEKIENKTLSCQVYF